METKLKRIAEVAKANPNEKFTSLAHLINSEILTQCHKEMKGKKAEITVWSADYIECDEKKIGFDGSPTRVAEIFSPPAREGGRLLEGEPNEVSKELATLLKDVIIG